MAIRTITDLPDISTAAELSSNLSASKMEISFLADSEQYRYESKSVSCGVLAEAIAADIMKRELLKTDKSQMSVSDKLSVGIGNEGNGLILNGNFYANNQSHYNFESKQYFKDYDINANDLRINSNGILKLQNGNAKIELNNDTVNRGCISLEQYATVEGTLPDNNKSVVNVDYLETRLAKLSNDIINAINSGAAHLDIDVNIGFPLLGIIYIDHEITDDSWKMSNSVITLADYPALQRYVIAHKNELKTNKNGSNDTWAYTFLDNDTKLRLPKTSWFFQGISDQDSTLSCNFIPASLPQHTHTYISNQSSQMADGVGSPQITVPTTGTSYYTSGKASGNIYKDGSTVQPNATKMFVYFYVGQKKY